MSIKIIEERLKEYAPNSQRNELNALKEITQEIALYALARANFFNLAAFQGGSCLRIIHQLKRFSEDLDFILIQPDKSFVWKPFLKALQLEFKLYSLEFDVVDRSQLDRALKTAFIKDNSFGKLLVLSHPRGPADKQTIKIKLEIDTNPPARSIFEKHFIDFPSVFSITTQDLSSLFASKCHALLCRRYTKGRDWFDFLWYVSKKITPNYVHLSHALDQIGPWKGQNIRASKNWLHETLINKIKEIDWDNAKKDVENFLQPRERESLKEWGEDLFLAMTKRL